MAFCVAATAAPESGNAAGSTGVRRRRRQTAARRPKLLLRIFQCAVQILIGVFVCIIRSAAPVVTHAKKKGVLPGSLVVWNVVSLGIYAYFLWKIVQLIRIKEKSDECSRR